MKTNLNGIDNDIHSFLLCKNSMDYVDKLVVGLKKVDKMRENLDFLVEKADNKHTSLSVLRTFPISVYLKIDKAIAGNVNSDADLLNEVYNSVLEWKEIIKLNHSYVSYLNQVNSIEANDLLDGTLFNIAINKNCPKELLGVIYEKFGRDSEKVSFGVASNQDCPKEILMDILRTDNSYAICKVIEKIELDSNTLNGLIDRGDGNILTAIVLHGKNVPLDVRQRVVNTYKTRPFTSSFYYYPCLSNGFFNRWGIDLDKESSKKAEEGLWKKIKRMFITKYKCHGDFR